MSLGTKILNVNQIENVFNTCPEERETSINISGNSQIMDVYTSDNNTLTKLKKIFKANPNSIECWEAGRNSDGAVTGYFFKMNRKHISFRSTAGRELSNEEREIMGERMRQLYLSGKLKKQI